MVIDTGDIWKLALACSLFAAIFISAIAHAPKHKVPGADLRRLVYSAITLYLVGALASATHHPVLAGIVYASGIFVCTLAVWLSRGSEPEDPPSDGDQPTDERPPPSPDGLDFDWGAFERAFRAYSESRKPVGMR